MSFPKSESIFSKMANFPVKTVFTETPRLQKDASMSVRIYQLAKDIGMESKDLVELLKNRGYKVKTASSTIDNISADALRDEFASPASDPRPESPVEETVEAKKDPAESPEVTSAPSSKPKFPQGVFVKSAADIQREREEKAATTRLVSRPKTPRMDPPPPPLILKQPPKPPNPPTLSPAGKVPSPPDVEAVSTESGELKKIHIKPPIVVRDFAVEIGLKPFKLISELMEQGIFSSMNQTIEEGVAIQLAQRHGYKLEIHHREKQAAQERATLQKKPDDDDPKFLEPRPPVVCILGHIDHGKTTLMDAIRKANSVDGEAGGITQHIGAYQIEHNGQKISFVDTPGHAAFSTMRKRGAHITDIAVLVIAADDAFKPQTVEALKFARKANDAIIVAINKIDTKGADVDRVKQQMQENGIAPEDWGGETITVEISALNGTNIDELLEMILLQAEVLGLKANPKCAASGSIIEAKIEHGHGVSALVIVEQGTLKKGHTLLCSETYCRVRTMTDADGKVLTEAPPATPVKVTGWSDVPVSGDKFTTEKSERTAKHAAEEATQKRKLELANSGNQSKSTGPTLDDLLAAIENQRKKCLPVVVKSDVHGSTEALVDRLNAISSDKVEIHVLQQGVGHITKNDITLAGAGGATIVGFNVKPDNEVRNFAKHHEVRIIQHEIIYELIDQVEEAMTDLLDSEYIEKKIGVAEVRRLFSIGKGRNVAGCMVTEGVIHRNCITRLIRNGETLHESKVETLKRFKDDVKEVRAGYECGVNLEDFNDYEAGDRIECFSLEEKRASL